MNNQRGFTLVEMLVALAIFAVISSAGVSIITFSLRESAPVAAASARLEQIQIGQIAGRAVRDSFGDSNAGGFQGGFVFGDQAVFSFVRRGWENPGGLDRRSSLQYVAYIYEDGNLRRMTRAMLDPTADTPEESVTLLTGVENLSISFYSNGRWSEQWASRGGSLYVPEVIAIEANIDGIGPLRQLFMTPGAT
jgi:general secretion pathway protein J